MCVRHDDRVRRINLHFSGEKKLEGRARQYVRREVRIAVTRRDGGIRIIRDIPTADAYYMRLLSASFWMRDGGVSSSGVTIEREESRPRRDARYVRNLVGEKYTVRRAVRSRE